MPSIQAATIAWLMLGLDAGRGDEARALFNKNCASCHGKDGRASTPIARKLGVKDLSLSKLPDAEIFKQIVEGKKSPDGKPLMPPFEKKLSPKDIKTLIPYLKAFRPK